MEGIKVHVLPMKGQPNLYMRYRDPTTGKRVSRSTGSGAGAEDAAEDGGEAGGSASKPGSEGCRGDVFREAAVMNL